MLDSDIIQPNSTFELRFDQPAVDDTLIGVSLESSPLMIDPPLKGRFVWLSRYSGVFTPIEPPRLQTTYTLQWDPSYLGSEKKPLNAKFLWQLKTPPFQVTAWGPAFSDTNNVPARPSILIQFNANVPAAGSIAYAEFRDRSGQICPARVHQATVHD